jgi:hypothetical protein
VNFYENTDGFNGISTHARALLALEQNLERYKNAVEIFSKKLLWQDIASKHIILYNLIVNNPNSSVLKKNMFSYYFNILNTLEFTFIQEFEDSTES